MKMLASRWWMASGALLAACGTSAGTGDGSSAGRDGGLRAADGAVIDSGGSGTDVVVATDGPRPIDSGVDFDGSVCAANRFAIHATPPNVLILLDRSCSMEQTPTGGSASATSGTSKWAIATAALHGLTAMYPTQVRWGLIYLPHTGTGGSCSGGAVCGGGTTCPEVAPAAGTGPMIDTVLGTISPFTTCGGGGGGGGGHGGGGGGGGGAALGTPIDQGLQACSTVTELHDTTRSDFVLLLTDGEETCVSQAQVVASVTALHGASIRTAVVGFGSAGGGGVNPAELNAMATAGGVPASGPTQYYAAQDSASLTAAFSTIVGAAISCTFALDAPAADPSSLHVIVNATTELTRDPTHAMGWDYDAASHSITLYGAACNDVRALHDSQIDVLQTCPGGMMPPPPTMCHHNGGACTTDTDCCNLEGLSCDTMHGTCIPAPG